MDRDSQVVLRAADHLESVPGQPARALAAELRRLGIRLTVMEARPTPWPPRPLQQPDILA